MYYRGDERRRAAPPGERTIGVAVWSAGRRFFFPGASEALAVQIARLVMGDALEAPGVRIEWGEADGAAWRCEQVLKESDEESTSGANH